MELGSRGNKNSVRRASSILRSLFMIVLNFFPVFMLAFFFFNIFCERKTTDLSKVSGYLHKEIEKCKQKVAR